MESVTLSTTHLISDATWMHQTALEDNEHLLETWEECLKVDIFQNKPLKLITRLMFTVPNKQRTSVLLHRAYPVLKDAHPAAVDITSPSANVFILAFDTDRFGKVHLLMTYNKDECDVLQSFIASSNADGTPSAVGGRPEMTLSMQRKGDPDKVNLVYTSMVIFQNGCKACKRTGVKMQKCGRCWEKLNFPVYYCCKECQKSDYTRHCQEERCGTI